MEDLVEKLDKHTAEDNRHFQTLSGKIDSLASLVTEMRVEFSEIRAQWRMATAVASAAIGLIGTLAGWYFL